MINRVGWALMLWHPPPENERTDYDDFSVWLGDQRRLRNQGVSNGISGCPSVHVVGLATHKEWTTCFAQLIDAVTARRTYVPSVTHKRLWVHVFTGHTEPLGPEGDLEPLLAGEDGEERPRIAFNTGKHYTDNNLDEISEERG